MGQKSEEKLRFIQEEEEKPPFTPGTSLKIGLEIIRDDPETRENHYETILGKNAPSHLVAAILYSTSL